MSESQSTNSLVIRHATEADVPLLFQMIMELAEYEKLTHEVVGTEALLHDAMFGERKVVEGLLVSWNGQPAGYAMFFHNFSTFLCRPGLYIEDIYVRESMRGHGIGKKIMIYLAQVAKERGCGRMEWSVLDWNEPSIQFYKKIGAVLLDEWTTCRVTGIALDQLANSNL